MPTSPALAGLALSVPSHPPTPIPWVPGNLSGMAHFLGGHLIPGHSLEVIHMSSPSFFFFFFELLTDLLSTELVFEADKPSPQGTVRISSVSEEESLFSPMHKKDRRPQPGLSVE